MMGNFGLRGAFRSNDWQLWPKGERFALMIGNFGLRGAFRSNDWQLWPKGSISL